MIITQKRLRELFHYDPETGIFTRKVTRRRGAIGAEPGTIKKGRRVIKIDDREYFAHRLAWLYIHGVFPAKVIDHRDGNPLNNRLSNLRDVPQCGNAQNLRHPNKNNKSGFLGVSPVGKAGKFAAQIKPSGSRTPKTLGIFDTPEAASDAYLVAKKLLHPYQTIA